MQLLPTKLIGVIADHGSFPIERIAVDCGGEGRWVGSVGHDDVLKMTDLREVFEDEEQVNEDNDDTTAEQDLVEPTEEPAGISSDEEEIVEVPKEKKRKRKKEKDALSGRKKKGRNQVDAEPSFFHGL